MKIKTRILVSAAIAVTLILCFILVVSISFDAVAEENKREWLANEIHTTVSQLDIILYDYLIHKEERMVQQWNSKYDTTLENIEKEKIGELETVKSNYVDLKNLFSQIVKSHEEQGSSELEERLVTSFLIKSHTIIFDTSRIAQEAYNSAIEAQRKGINIILVSATILFALLLAVAIHTAREITKPLEKLTAKTKEIGKGELKHKIGIKSYDEIEELSTAFNKMAKELHKSKSKIEKKVEDRTKSLNQKVKELTEMRTAVFNMMEDMDESRKEIINSERELKKAYKELKKLDIQKDEFLSITAHELKTPITSIHGFSQLLKSGKVKSKKRKKYLDIIDSETKRLAELITDMLELSRIDLGTIKTVMEEMDVNEVVEQAVSQVEPYAKKKNIKIEYKVQPGIPTTISDKEKILQILLNLINNAVKYSEKGIIKVGVMKAGNKIQFSVQDTGLGIPKKTHNKIFTRFFQVDSSFTRKSGGTGLGLSISKEYVQLLGGEIWFKSVEGKGTTFFFTIPIIKPGKVKSHEQETEKEDSDEFKKKGK
jgi:signal transduction histidine kinase